VADASRLGSAGSVDPSRDLAVRVATGSARRIFSSPSIRVMDRARPRNQAMTSRPACPGRRGRRCVAAIRGDRVDARELIRRRDGDSILHTEHIAAPRRGRLSGRAVARRSRQSGPDRPDPRGGGLRRGQAAGARAAARGVRTLAAQLFVDPEVAERFVHIETAAQASGSFLRILLCIDPSAQELHGLHWELLCHPRTGAALGTSETVLLSRFMVSRDWRPVSRDIRFRGEMLKPRHGLLMDL
jgi:hypothetical protein